MSCVSAQTQQETSSRQAKRVIRPMMFQALATGGAFTGFWLIKGQGRSITQTTTIKVSILYGLVQERGEHYAGYRTRRSKLASDQ